jgi:hypothetical protein
VRVGSKSRKTTDHTPNLAVATRYILTNMPPQKKNLSTLVFCNCSRASCNKPVSRRTRDRHRRNDALQNPMDVDTSSAESTSSDTPSPTIPTANPRPSQDEPAEEPDPESQGHTGVRENNELVDGYEGIMDIDYTDDVFDDTRAEVEPLSCRNTRGESIHHIVGLLI